MENADISKNRISIFGLIAIATGSILSSLDLFIVNMAFTSIQKSFSGSSLSSVSWVLSIYSICFAATLILSGKLADKYGRKKIFCVGLGMFGISSLACAISPTLLILVLSRAFQGVAAAMMVPTSLSLLLAAYPKEQHKQVVGLWAAAGSVAATCGPLLGGYLVGIDWHLIFSINTPIVVLGLLCAMQLSENSHSSAPLPDFTGSLLLIVSIAGLVGSIEQLSSTSSHRTTELWIYLITAISLFLLIFHSTKTEHPALNLSLFKSPTFTVAVIGMGCFYMGFAITLLGGSLYLTQVLAMDSALAGLAFSIGPASAVIASLLIGRIKQTPQQLAIIGSILYVITGIWWYCTLSQYSEHSYAWFFLPGLIMTGVGAGVVQTGFVVGGVAHIPQHLYATGSAIINTSRQLGAAIGIASFAAISGSASNAEQFQNAWVLTSITATTAALSAVVMNKSIS